MPPALTADEAALLDEPRLARVVGARPGSILDVSASFTTWNGRRWAAAARFRVGPSGVVDLARDVAVSGIGTGALALVTSMERVAGDGERASVMVAREVELSVDVEGTRLSRTVLRKVAGPEVTRELVNDGDVVGAAYFPGDARAPGVVVLGGSTGEPDYTTAALLASRGFSTLALAYFHAPGTSPHLRAVPLERFARGAAWLRARTGHAFVATWGTSRGAEAALAAAAHTGAFSAVVSVAGSGLRHAGVAPPEERERGAWTFRGRPLAHVEEKNPLAPPDDPTFAGARDETASVHLPTLRHAPSVKRSAIPVERIEGPVLLVSGTDDRCWPSARLSSWAADRRRKAGRPTEELVFPGAGHFLGPPYLPCTTDRYTHALTGRTYLAGGTADADAAACEAFWTRAVDVLREAARVR